MNRRTVIWTGRSLFVALLGYMLSVVPVSGQDQLSLSNDMVLDAQALLMPRNAVYGPVINGASYQTEALTTVGDYQYATWYHYSGNQEYVYLGRRELGSTTWDVANTGQTFDDGDNSWDAHNVISMGIDTDGQIHLSYDHHNSYLNYRNTSDGAAWASEWNPTLNAEQNTLNSNINPPPSPFNDVTYPRFINDPSTGNLVMTFRNGTSGDGNVYIATYDPASNVWDTPHMIINGRTGTYSDALGSSSSRNAYLNGLDIDSNGRMHTTWTWRESAGGTNHDIMYAYSDDGGDTWLNNSGTVIGTLNNPINLNSAGATVVSMDRRNTLMNQQTQLVDGDGTVHSIMWHATDDNADAVNGFTTGPAAYYHYFRNANDVWERTELPTDRKVGSRPDMAVDSDGNLYAFYVSPGAGDGAGVLDYYTNGDLVIATASRATGWQDWEIVYTDTRDFVGEPQVDRNRLLQDGVLSVYLQENGNNLSGSTGSALHVFELDRLAQHLVWAGTAAGEWNTGGTNDWDSYGDNQGDTTFANGYRVTFDDGGGTMAVNITEAVAPSSTTFKNNARNNYTLTGQGIAGSGSLRVTGGGFVTLNNAANSYSGNTQVEWGTLSLSGEATIAASPVISVSDNATLNVSALNSTFSVAAGQVLEVATEGRVIGDTQVGSTAAMHASGSVYGSLVVQSAGMLRVGAAGLTQQVGNSSYSLIDNFDSYNNATNQNIGSHSSGDVTNGAWDGVFDGTNNAQVVDEGTSNQSLEVWGLPAQGGNGWRGAKTDLSSSYDLDFTVEDSETTTLFFQFKALDNTGVFDTMFGLSDDVANIDNADAWQDFAVMPFLAGGGIGAADFKASTTTGDQIAIENVAADQWYNVWLVVDTQTNLFDIYTSLGDDDGTLAVSNAIFRNGYGNSSMAAFGINGRESGRVQIDNLYMSLGANTANPLTGSGGGVYAVESLLVEGDLTLEQGALLQLDIATAGVSDTIEVTGQMTLAGTLELTLAEGATAPELGEGYDLFEFASAVGAFDDFVLPELADGWGWNTTQLGISGMLSVGLAGDYNGDGTVNLADYTVWRDHLGSDWISNRDTLLTGVVGLDDYQVWKDNFGATLPAGEFAAQAVPEPATLAWCSLVFASLLLYHASQRYRGVQTRLCR
ncbi:BNR repeat-containing protein [Aeoliella mucimassa]|uniref:Autotransporter-associated beta strand repeat protein n=1 Tax=Aeoliella mucimassa TaxID=2527972 RepID=A0A518AK54_9BACT|nr:BNR repeat-containing protein [Aeoliella mucimassa]QDU55112.1 hypothetical protein Pan181_12980 [Aeoliella mucimassa]